MFGATFCHANMEELFIRKTLGPVGLDSAGDCKLLFGAAFLLLLGVSMAHQPTSSPELSGGVPGTLH